MAGAAPFSNGEKKDTRFQPGQVVPGRGRPKGTRNKLGEDFLKALQQDFAEYGMAAIVEVRENRPQDYVKVIASILPKEIDLSGEVEITSKEQREAAVAAFMRSLN